MGTAPDLPQPAGTEGVGASSPAGDADLRREMPPGLIMLLVVMLAALGIIAPAILAILTAMALVLAAIQLLKPKPQLPVNTQALTDHEIRTLLSVQFRAPPKKARRARAHHRRRIDGGPPAFGEMPLFACVAAALLLVVGVPLQVAVQDSTGGAVMASLCVFFLLSVVSGRRRSAAMPAASDSRLSALLDRALDEDEPTEEVPVAPADPEDDPELRLHRPEDLPPDAAPPEPR